MGLIVGMYVQAEIATSSERTKSISSDAIVEVDGESHIFTAERQGNNWYFTSTMVKKVKEEGDLVAIETKEPADCPSRIVQSGTCYLLSEVKKGETGEERNTIETQRMLGRREIVTLSDIHHVSNIKRTRLQLIFMGDGWP